MAGADEATVQADYDAFHRRRVEILLNACAVTAPGRDTLVLDVGRAAVSMRLLRLYDLVWTLGYPVADPLDGGLSGHIAFDLNQAFGATAPLSELRFDLIVFAETLEHLFAPPERVLGALASLLAPGGAIICQTPNAAALSNRVKLLLGRNPYERLRDTPGNLGHIRESTKAELVEFARVAGLRVERHSFHEYFDWPPGGWMRRAAEAAIRAASALIPSLRRGQMAVLRRASGEV